MSNDNLSDYIKQINETFGPANKCFGKEFRLNFPANDLESFLKGLEEEKFGLFNRSVVFFRIHMEPLFYLIDEDTNKADDPIKFLYPHVWSKLAFSIIFSIIDTITTERYLPISEFLSNRFESIKTKDDIEKLCAEYNKNYATRSRLINFYNSYLGEDDKKDIVESYMAEGEKRIEKIERVISDIYGKVRSGFLHNMGMTAPYHEGITFSESEQDEIVICKNLSPSQFLFYSWKAIFKFFGYKSEINTNFLEEEMKSGKTIKGTKISFPLA